MQQVLHQNMKYFILLVLLSYLGLWASKANAGAETNIYCQLQRTISDKTDFNGPTTGSFSATFNDENRSIRLNSMCNNMVVQEFSQEAITVECDDEIFSSSYKIDRISGDLVWSLFPKKTGGFLMHFGRCIKVDKAF